MVETIKLNDFFRSGKFGEFQEINFGMRRDNLIEVLGETEWIHYSRRKSKFPSIYKYDKIEFYFEEGEEGRLFGIQLKLETNPADLGKLKIDYGIVNESLLFTDITCKLDELGIVWKEFKQEFDDNEIFRILTDGGVQLIFGNDNNDELALFQASKFITFKSNSPKTKQINITILEEDYNELKALAKENKISISNYCADLISKNIKANQMVLLSG